MVLIPKGVMFSNRVFAALAAFLIPLASTQSMSTPTYTGALSEMTSKGCFSDSEPLELAGTYIYQTAGNCQPICVGFDKVVMALANGDECWCGDLIPAKSSQVEDSECDTPCAGYDKDDCGGPDMFHVSLTGATLNDVEYYDSDSSSSSSAADSEDSVVTVDGSTVILTLSSEPTDGSLVSEQNEDGGSGSNTTSIAVGVVVGVVALAAFVTGTIFYLRYRRRKVAEANCRQQFESSAFGTGKLPHTSPSSDRWSDPDVRRWKRMSDGSIADNEDHSRRILQVVNPDSR